MNEVCKDELYHILWHLGWVLIDVHPFKKYSFAIICLSENMNGVCKDELSYTHCKFGT
mgnify:CR=1 FL=1